MLLYVFLGVMVGLLLWRQIARAGDAPRAHAVRVVP